MAVRFADALGLSDEFAFAGAGSVNKTLNKVDDALGKTVAKVEGKVDGTLDDLTKVNHTEIPKWDSKKMLESQQGMDEALKVHKVGIDEMNDINVEAGKHNYNYRESVLIDDISKLRAISDTIGVPKTDEIIAKVWAGLEIKNPLDAFPNKKPGVSGFVAKATDTKNIVSFEDLKSGLSLEYTHVDDANRNLNAFTSSETNYYIIDEVNVSDRHII